MGKGSSKYSHSFWKRDDVSFAMCSGHGGTLYIKLITTFHPRFFPPLHDFIILVTDIVRPSLVEEDDVIIVTKIQNDSTHILLSNNVTIGAIHPL